MFSDSCVCMGVRARETGTDKQTESNRATESDVHRVRERQHERLRGERNRDMPEREMCGKIAAERLSDNSVDLVWYISCS